MCKVFVHPRGQAFILHDCSYARCSEQCDTFGLSGNSSNLHNQKINFYFGSFIMQLVYIVVLSTTFWECILSASSFVSYHQVSSVIHVYKKSFLL